MTKTYIKPETKIVKIESQAILQTGSPGNINTEVGGEQLGRGFGFFEEEDIEEEY